MIFHKALVREFANTALATFFVLLGITITTLATNPDFVPGTTVVTNDHFNTRNVFHGIDLGLRQRRVGAMRGFRLPAACTKA